MRLHWNVQASLCSPAATVIGTVINGDAAAYMLMKWKGMKKEMIYTELIRKAMIMAFNAHNGQLDKGSVPYIYHPIHVAEKMPDEATTCVALLHDVVEDTALTLKDIEKAGFSTEVITAISIMTHKRGMPYMDYIKIVKKNPMARIVKLADLEHNCDLSRLPVVTEKDHKRVEKYQKAIAFLES